jgi:hypothetical protein
MTEYLTERAYEWLRSPYDQTWHVFPCDQVAGPVRRMYIVALCSHSTLINLVERTPSDSLCPPCARALTLRLSNQPLSQIAG